MKKRKIISTLTLSLLLIGILGLAINVGTVMAPVFSSQVGLWHLDEGMGSTAFDSGDYGNDGTLSGGKFGNALDFDGAGDYVEIPYDIGFASAFTVEAWIYPTASGKFQMIVTKDTSSYITNYNLQITSSDKLRLFISGLTLGTVSSGSGYVNTSGIAIDGSTSVSTNVWHHVAGVYTGTDIQVYLDGLLDGSASVTGTPTTNSEYVWIGKRKAPVPLPFEGRIDEVRISNVARSTFITTTQLVTDGLTVALWHFDESVGDTVFDETTNNNDGTTFGATWAGPTWTNGMFGSALQFDGVDDYIEIDDSMSLDLAEFTIEAWVYIEELKKYNGILIKGSDGAENYELLIGYPTVDDVVSAVLFTDGRDWLTTGGVISLNTWHHIAVTYGSTEWKIYVDGIIEAERSYSTPRTPITNNLPLWIGNEQGKSGRVTNGKIDEARIWSRVLSPEEVKRHSWGLVGEWLFDYGSGSTAYDTSGFGNHGTIYGATKTVGRYNTGLSFDGSNDRVEIDSAPNLQLTNKGTLEFWFKPESGFGGYDAFVLKGTAGGTGGYTDLEFGVNRHTDGSIKGWISDHTGFDIIYTNTKSWTVGEWYHIAFTWDGSNLNIYVDGESDATPVPQTRNAYVTDELVTLGRIRGHWYNGLLDELRIYNEALVPITFDQTGLDSSAVGELVVTVSDPIPLYYEGLPFVMMIPSGINVGYTFESIVSDGTGKQFSLQGVTGGSSPSGTAAAPTSIIGNYETQYYLTVETDPAGLTSFAEEGWYDQGTEVELTAPYISGYTFLYWDVDGTDQDYEENPITVTMNSAHTATAHYFEWVTVSGTKYEDIDGTQPTSTPLEDWTMNLYAFCDDFNDGVADGWIEGPGSWTVESDGSYVYSKLDETILQHTYSIVDGLTVGDFIAEVKIKQLTDQLRDCGIQFWHQDEDNYFYANFDDNELGLWKFKNGNYYTDGFVHRTTHSYDLTEWHTIRIEVVGTSFKLYIDDNLEWTDTLDDWFSGGIGVHAHRDSYTQFDDFCVYDTTTTDSTGDYSFTVKRPGTYKLCEVPQEGWTQMYPADCYSIDIDEEDAGTTILDKDFWNFEWTTVSGYKFFDGDGGGVNEDEPGLEYWDIELYKDGSLDGSDTTDENGYYEIQIKDPGIYTVKETLLADWWIRTTDDYTFTVVSGEPVNYDFGNWLGPSEVTTSGLCWFDKDEAEGRQFRVIFTPDVANDPNTYKVSATNPGQFYYNVFYSGEVSMPFEISLPDAFETQGATPVHVYGSVNTGPCGCLIPGDDISDLFTINLDGNSITVTPNDGYSGFVYITVHCDYELKQTGGYEPKLYEDEGGVWRAHAAKNDVVEIEDLTDYTFSVSGPVSDSQTLQNRNNFKKIRGIAGLIEEAGEGVAGIQVRITGPDGFSEIVETDDDGFYGYSFHHKGKEATYTIDPDGYETKEVDLKAGRFAEVNFP